MADEKPKSQKEKFVAAARALGCDESESAFNEKLKKLAGQKPPLEKPKGKK